MTTINHRQPRRKTYYCACCNVTMESTGVPHGWLSASRFFGAIDGVFPKPSVLGMYCSLVCLARHAGELVARDKSHVHQGNYASAAD